MTSHKKLLPLLVLLGLLPTVRHQVLRRLRLLHSTSATIFL